MTIALKMLNIIAPMKEKDVCVYVCVHWGKNYREVEILFLFKVPIFYFLKKT
jgi:hypothetical protein